MSEIVVGLTTAALLANEPFGLRDLAGAVLIMSASAIEVAAKPALGTPGKMDTDYHLS
jgi:hypothetical protein